LAALPPTTSRARSRSGVQHADDVLDRRATAACGYRARRDLAHQFLGRQVGVDGAHLGAVDHHVRTSSSCRSAGRPSCRGGRRRVALAVEQVGWPRNSSWAESGLVPASGTPKA
jgi:hypothetical protein